MIRLQTTVTLPPAPSSVEYGEGIVSIGSCFGQHIGQHLQALGHKVLVNPFGIQYNPLSIALSLRRLIEGKPTEQGELFHHQGLWHSWGHHGDYSAPTPEMALERMHESYAKARELLVSARYLLLTWGTAYIYRLAQTGQVVSNCHRMPEQVFLRSRASVESLVTEWQEVLMELKDFNPHMEIIQTISPIRHQRDGLHHNQLSKSTLLLFAEAIAESSPLPMHYFPSYEIVLDELRDYRYYDEDLIHPSPLARRIVADRFTQWLSSPHTLALYPEVERLQARLKHRPRPGTPPHEAKVQILSTLQATEHFVAQHPEVDLSIPLQHYRDLYDAI